jgi:hypothetical protein
MNCITQMTNQVNFQKKLSKVFITLLGLIGTFGHSSVAFAWKPTTHVYLAEQAMNDAIDDGKITVYKVDYQTGKVILEGGLPVKVGDYEVDPDILDALKTYPAQYRAGVLGPDAYPDILTGQQVIHPNTNNAGGTDAWLRHLWESAYRQDKKRIKAFVVGYLTHAAGDMYGHTFINNFTGAPFAIEPPKGPENAIKHIVLEGYIDKLIPDPIYDARIEGVEDFIYKTMIDATPGSKLDTQLLVKGGEGTAFSVPRRYSTIRARLAADSKAFSDRLDEYNRRIDDKLRAAKDCKPWDFSCSRIKLGFQASAIGTERAGYVAKNKLQIEYKRAWKDDIDAGLRAWPKVSHEVAKALFFNRNKKADTSQAKELLTQYAIDHLIKMEGSPDTASSLINIVREIVPDVKFIKDLKKKFYHDLIKKATGINIEDLEKYLSEPATYFDLVMSKGAGERVNRQTFHEKYWPNPEPSKFNYFNYPAAYNTVLMSKLILLKQSEVNRLVKDLGDNISVQNNQYNGGYNVMLGVVGTLDGDNEWSQGRDINQSCNISYSKIFMRQPGEKKPCSSTSSQPSSSATAQPVCYDVDSKRGWQHFNLPGSFTKVTRISGGWSVDTRNYSPVGASGHSGSDATALEPYNQYKYDQKLPFGALIVDIPSSGYIWVPKPQQLLKPITETTMRINDSDNSLGDNSGSMQVCFGN